jgi:hypothetical protein
MIYRTVDTAMWSADAWFQELTPMSKLVFLNLFTNQRQTACGAFKVTPHTLRFETGLDSMQLFDAMEELQRPVDGTVKVQWWPSLGVVWVRNFYKHQRANSSDKFRVHATRALQDFPAEVRDAVWIAYPELRYPTDTPTIGYQETTDTLAIGVAHVTETVTVTEAKQDVDGSKQTSTNNKDATKQTSAPKALARADNFTPFVERCWQKYPRDGEGRQCGSKKQFVTQVRGLQVTQWDDFEQAVENYGQSRNVKRGYVKAAESWVKLGLWQNFVGSAEAREVVQDEPKQQRPETRYTRTTEYFRQRAAEAAASARAVWALASW